MKTTYITYRIVEEKVILVLARASNFWSGTLSKEQVPGSTVLGSLDIYEGRESFEPEEKIVFCLFDKELHAHPSHFDRHPTQFPINQPMPIDEMDTIQRKAIGFVVKGQSFQGSLYFVDKKRLKIFNESITPSM